MGRGGPSVRKLATHLLVRELNRIKHKLTYKSLSAEDEEMLLSVAGNKYFQQQTELKIKERAILEIDAIIAKLSRRIQ